MTRFSLLYVAVLIIFSISPSLGQRSFVFNRTWPHASIPSMNLHGSAVAVDFEDNLLILHRGSRFAFPERNNTIQEGVVVVISRDSGEMLRQWGENFFHHPHGIEAADNGDIFVTDSHLHQVFKFAYIPETKVWNDTPIMVLGERLVNGSGPAHFYIPADVAIEPDTENFYVADGYGNTRVVKFDRCGNYMLEFPAGTPPGTVPIPFNIVHKLTVAIRHTPTANRAVRRGVSNQDVIVAVVDRDNCRMQYFSGNGTFLHQQTCAQLGMPSTFLMSVAHADVNPRESPYYEDVDADFGLTYAVSVGSGAIPPRVAEIGVDWSSATMLSHFSTNISDPHVQRGPAHDLTVRKDGTEVYVVVSNSNTLIIKRFDLIVESSAMRNFLISTPVLLAMVYLSTVLTSL